MKLNNVLSVSGYNLKRLFFAIKNKKKQHSYSSDVQLRFSSKLYREISFVALYFLLLLQVR